MKKIFLLIVLIYSCTLLPAQMVINEKPYSSRYPVSDKGVPSIQISPPNAGLIAERDSFFKRHNMSGYAVPMEVQINMQNSGYWQKTSNGGKLWLLNISSSQAKTLSIDFDKFQLPANARFWVYQPDKEVVIGAFTSANNKAHSKQIQASLPPVLYGMMKLLWSDFISPPQKIQQSQSFPLAKSGTDIETYPAKIWLKY